MIRVLGLYLRTRAIGRSFHTSNCSHVFELKKSGYPIIYDRPPNTKNLSLLDKFRLGCKQFKQECRLLAQETRELFNIHPPIFVAGEDDIVWQFDGTEQSLDKWVLTCDSDYNQGFSQAKLELSPRGTGIFHGQLSCDLPNDGKTRRAGYCNITTVPKQRSFKRKYYYDWSQYNHLVLRVRGDGRCYMLNILQKGYLDITWNNAFHYGLYTRGGPYWQTVKVPFSKFVFSGKGIVQDSQTPLSRMDISNFGITLADNKPGPFKLEIDYVGVCLDEYHFEESAYEMNDVSQF